MGTPPGITRPLPVASSGVAPPRGARLLCDLGAAAEAAAGQESRGKLGHICSGRLYSASCKDGRHPYQQLAAGMPPPSMVDWRQRR